MHHPWNQSWVPQPRAQFWFWFWFWFINQQDSLTNMFAGCFVLGPLLFQLFSNNLAEHTSSTVRLFDDDCTNQWRPYKTAKFCRKISTSCINGRSDGNWDLMPGNSTLWELLTQRRNSCCMNTNLMVKVAKLYCQQTAQPTLELNCHQIRAGTWRGKGCQVPMGHSQWWLGVDKTLWCLYI